MWTRSGTVLSVSSRAMIQACERLGLDTEAMLRSVGVSRETLEAGDLVFYATEAPGPSHVGMVVGGDEFVHAPSSRGDVRVERMSSRYWAARYVGARRLR